MHDGNCYPNGSYFLDDVLQLGSLMCVLPDSTLHDGQWVARSGPVNCSTDPLHCDEQSSPANLSLYTPEGQYLLSSDDGWFQCCLPTNCSDPDTRIITANIYSKIEQFFLSA